MDFGSTMTAPKEWQHPLPTMQEQRLQTARPLWDRETQSDSACGTAARPQTPDGRRTVSQCFGSTRWRIGGPKERCRVRVINKISMTSDYYHIMSEKKKSSHRSFRLKAFFENNIRNIIVTSSGESWTVEWDGAAGLQAAATLDRQSWSAPRLVSNFPEGQALSTVSHDCKSSTSQIQAISCCLDLARAQLQFSSNDRN